MRKLKLFNGRDWDCRGGHLYVAAYSMADAARLASEAYQKLHPGITWEATSISEVKVYWSKGQWGTSMSGVEPERGVWWGKAIQGGWAGKPERII